MNRRQFGRIVGAVLTFAIFPPLARGSAAQDDTVRIEGKVAWISGEKMVVAPPGGLPVPVDLSQVDQDQYSALLSGDRVIVTGRLSPDRDRVVAMSVQRVES